MEYPAEMQEKLSQYDIANYIARRGQLACQQDFISAIGAIGGVCKDLESELASFRSKLYNAALKHT